MRVLVTGATGNIGVSAVRALAERGHQVRAMVYGSSGNLGPLLRHPQVERFSGDVRDAARVREAVAGQDAIIHLAYIIPPQTNERPDLARAVNLDGTHNVIAAAQSQATPPRLLFSSTLDLFGRTMHLPPPRTLADPLEATDLYTEHKLACEQWLQQSGLPWLIFRFSDVPIIGFRSPHPIMYDIPLDQRIEVLHTLDAGLAIANALERDDVWRRIWLIGGGAGCQLTYRQFIFGLFSVMGLGELPERAFTTRAYVTDWLDTTESQAALRYQRHTFQGILAEVAAQSRLQRRITPLVRPLVQRYLLSLSPYMAKTPRD